MSDKKPPLSPLSVYESIIPGISSKIDAIINDAKARIEANPKDWELASDLTALSEKLMPVLEEYISHRDIPSA